MVRHRHRGPFQHSAVQLLSPVGPKQYEYDPAKAAAMLDEVGWVVGDDGIREKDGVASSFTCTAHPGDQARRPIAELAQCSSPRRHRHAVGRVARVLDGMCATAFAGCVALLQLTHLTNAVEPDPFGTLHWTAATTSRRSATPS
ncbi:MAG: hypothetical protein R2838_07820 [Caldilineaceae bacterium]